MGFFDELGKVVGGVLSYAGHAQKAKQEVDQVLSLTIYGARKRVRDFSNEMSETEWEHFFRELEEVASNDTGDKGRMAGELAEYAEALRR